MTTKQKLSGMHQQIKAHTKLMTKLIDQRPYMQFWVSKRQAAKMYDVSERTIHNWHTQGKLKSKFINEKPYYSIHPLLLEENEL